MEYIKESIGAILKIAAGIAILGLVALLLLPLIAFGVDFYVTVRYGKGWVNQEKHMQAYKTIIKEENGCVYFIDVWNNEDKMCGIYGIKKY